MIKYLLSFELDGTKLRGVNSKLTDLRGFPFPASRVMMDLLLKNRDDFFKFNLNEYLMDHELKMRTGLKDNFKDYLTEHHIIDLLYGYCVFFSQGSSKEESM